MGFIVFFILVIVLCSFFLLRNVFGGSRDGYWDGPKQTKEQLNAYSRWLVDYLIKYPDSDVLVACNPKEAAKARAARRYNELEALKRAGKIDEIDYQLELEKIIPLIDISDLEEK